MKYKNQVFDVQFFSSKDAESLNVNDSDIMFKFEDKEDFNLTNNVFQKIDSGMHIKTKDSKGELLSRMYINQVTITKDALGLFEPVYSIDYIDIIYQTNKTIEEVTFEELIKSIESERLFKYDIRGLRKLFNDILLSSYDKKLNGKDFIKTETRVFKEGFFIKDGKVIENTLITNTKPTNDDIAKAIRLVNDIIKDRDSAIANDCTLFRFMLWSPFNWCLKEIGKTLGSYGLILTGAPKTNKTGSCLNFSWLYSTPQDREKR